jgi:hypothetical protein
LLHTLLFLERKGFESPFLREVRPKNTSFEASFLAVLVFMPEKASQELFVTTFFFDRSLKLAFEDLSYPSELEVYQELIEIVIHGDDSRFYAD